MPGSPPTRRVVDTLEHLAASDAPLTIAQIADAVGVARPTMSAILSELDAAGWVERDASRAYRLGPGAAGLGSSPAGSASVITPDVVSVLDELVAATSCGVTVSRISDDRMTVVAKVHSQTRPVPGLGLGQTLTVSYPTAAAVMAWRPSEAQAQWRGHAPDVRQRASGVLATVRDLGYAAYRPASSDASLVESLADLLSAVGPMLIDPTVRRSAIRQLAELSSRAYRSADLLVDESLPISYLAAPIFHGGRPDYELQLGVLRSSVGPAERGRFGQALTEAAARVSALLDAETA
ncbi:MarR family transcriptional regulator [Gordonia sp. HY442]|uniref:helix-turn-helix domain-containing protein n=1 Tax=Gordonia zhenghanii TaxID=2911516 RepID=UPI001F0108A8|nr:helix-turn-helix domain-containing protein [Gordonia zhenghanii]MCF8606510.1 MarR family transcriptional regulator [Gordonia zhenghanii]